MYGIVLSFHISLSKAFIGHLMRIYFLFSCFCAERDTASSLTGNTCRKVPTNKNSSLCRQKTKPKTRISMLYITSSCPASPSASVSLVEDTKRRATRPFLITARPSSSFLRPSAAIYTPPCFNEIVILRY